MTQSMEDANTFLIWMAKLIAKTEILLTKSKEAPLADVSVEYHRLESIWENYLDHANRFSIDLQNYKDQVNKVINNLEQVRENIEKRSHSSVWERITAPSLSIARAVDKVLIGLGLRQQPLLEPIVNIFFRLLKIGKPLLDGPHTPPQLLPPFIENNEIDRCPYCLGTKKVECVVCGGTGFKVNLLFYKEECTLCNSTGKVICLHCAMSQLNEE